MTKEERRTIAREYYWSLAGAVSIILFVAIVPSGGDFDKGSGLETDWIFFQIGRSKILAAESGLHFNVKKGLVLPVNDDAVAFKFAGLRTSPQEFFAGVDGFLNACVVQELPDLNLHCQRSL